MLRLLLTFVLFLTPAFAVADATITISLTGAGAANTSRTLVIVDGDGARFLAWAKAAYGPQLTNAQAAAAVFDAMFLALRTNVVDYDKAAATKTAADGVPGITPK